MNLTSSVTSDFRGHRLRSARVPAIVRHHEFAPRCHPGTRPMVDSAFDIRECKDRSDIFVRMVQRPETSIVRVQGRFIGACKLKDMKELHSIVLLSLLLLEHTGKHKYPSSRLHEAQRTIPRL